MLVQFTDSDGRETWVNPIHVKVVRASQTLFGKAKGGSEIWLGWDAGSTPVTVARPPEEVATLLNAGMPEYPPIITDDGSSTSSD